VITGAAANSSDGGGANSHGPAADSAADADDTGDARAQSDVHETSDVDETPDLAAASDLEETKTARIMRLPVGNPLGHSNRVVELASRISRASSTASAIASTTFSPRGRSGDAATDSDGWLGRLPIGNPLGPISRPRLVVDQVPADQTPVDQASAADSVPKQSGAPDAEQTMPSDDPSSPRPASPHVVDQNGRVTGSGSAAVLTG
jgi:hypothetical protein